MVSWIFKEGWFWFIVIALASIIIVPFFVVEAILNLPPIFRGVAMVVLIFLWGAAGAYKEWVKSKREEEKKMKSTKSPESA